MRTIGGQNLFVFGQGMAREVEAEDFLFLGQLLPRRPIGDVGQIGGGLRGVFLVAEEAHLSIAAVGSGGSPRLEGAVDGGKTGGAAAEGVHRARLHQGLDGRAVDRPGIEPRRNRRGCETARRLSAGGRSPPPRRRRSL